MADFWTILANFIKGIDDFLLWYINDTHLLPETLDAISEWWGETLRITLPVIGDYINLISEYFRG